MHSKLLFDKISAYLFVKLHKFLCFAILSLDPGALIVMSGYLSLKYSGQHHLKLHRHLAMDIKIRMLQ